MRDHALGLFCTELRCCREPILAPKIVCVQVSDELTGSGRRCEVTGASRVSEVRLVHGDVLDRGLYDCRTRQRLGTIKNKDAFDFNSVFASMRSGLAETRERRARQQSFRVSVEHCGYFRHISSRTRKSQSGHEHRFSANIALPPWPSD